MNRVSKEVSKCVMWRRVQHGQRRRGVQESAFGRVGIEEAE